MKYTLLILAGILFIGCSDLRTPAYYEKRHRYFIECLEVSTKASSHGDTEWEEVVTNCGTQAYYLVSKDEGK